MFYLLKDVFTGQKILDCQFFEHLETIKLLASLSMETK